MCELDRSSRDRCESRRGSTAWKDQSIALEAFCTASSSRIGGRKYRRTEVVDDVTPKFPLMEAAFPFLVSQRTIDAVAGGKGRSQIAAEEMDGQNVLEG